jgi:hypothetical protein
MIRRIVVRLAFPEDTGWTEVSSLVIDASWKIDRQAFNDEKKSCIDKFGCSLRFDKTLLTRIRETEGKIGISVTTPHAEVLFSGVLDPSTSHDTSDHLGFIDIEASDNSWRLDEKIKVERQLPQSVLEEGFALWDSLHPERSISHILLLDDGYTLDELDSGIHMPKTIRMVSVEVETATYREVLDTLFMEYGVVLHAQPNGVLTLLPWRPSADPVVIDRKSLSTVRPFHFERRFDRKNGARVTWALPEVIPDVLVYRDSLPVDSEGNFEGHAVASGDFYPADSDIEDIYQTYVENWLDKPYLSRETRLKNKDLTLIATSESHTVVDADEGIGIDLAKYESRQAQVRFKNNASEAGKIYSFEIYANALIRKKVGESTATPSGSSLEYLEYASQYVFDKDDGDALAEALAYAALAEETYQYGLNYVLAVGTKVRLIEQRNGTDVLAVIQRAEIKGGSAVVEYTAVQYLDQISLQKTHQYTDRTMTWPALTVQDITAVAVLSNDVAAVPAEADGSSPDLTGAVATLSVMLGTTDVTNLYSVNVTPSPGISGSLSGTTYTVSGMTVDSGYVDFIAVRAGWPTLTKRFSLAKQKQGQKGDSGTDGTNGQDAPRCLGLFAYADRDTITGMLPNDLAVFFSSTTEERGIYKYSGSIWEKLASPTQDQISRCAFHILDAVQQGYGVSSDYSAGLMSFEQILTRFVFALDIIATGSITGATVKSNDGKALFNTTSDDDQQNDGINVSTGNLFAPTNGNWKIQIVRAATLLSTTVALFFKKYNSTSGSWENKFALYPDLYGWFRITNLERGLSIVLGANGDVTFAKASTSTDDATEARIVTDKMTATHLLVGDQVRATGILQIPLFEASSLPDGAIWMV